MNDIAAILVCVAAIGTSAAAGTIGEVFREHFQIALPDGYELSHAGGKQGERQFSLAHGSDYLVSLFVYYDGLDARRWPTCFEEGMDVFLYREDQVFVYTELPDDTRRPDSRAAGAAAVT